MKIKVVFFNLLLFLIIIDLYYVSFFEGPFLDVSEAQFLISPGIVHVHFLALFIFLFVLKRFISNIQMETYYDEYSEWVMFFILLNIMKSIQLILIRSTFGLLNVVLNSYVYWKGLFVNSNKPIKPYTDFLRICLFVSGQITLLKLIVDERSTLVESRNSVLRQLYIR